MSVLNMRGCVDGVFKSVPASRKSTREGEYVDGIWVQGSAVSSDYQVTIQPVSDREIDFLMQGGERVTDARRIYINSGDLESIDQTGEWEFLGQKWKAVKVDCRPWRKYCKCIVIRIDDQ